MMNQEYAGQQGGHCLKRISWSAIVIGALVAIGLSFLLNLFAVSIGLSLTTTSQTGIASLAVGGFVGLLISVLVAMFVAGSTAGYLGREHCPKRNLGVVYGFSAWCLSLILTVLLTSHIMHFVSNYSNLVTNQANVSMTQNYRMPSVMVRQQDANTSAVILNAQKATNQLGYASFAIFILFLVGALASCFGGHYGMTCMCCKKCKCSRCGCKDGKCNCGPSCASASCCGKCGCTSGNCHCDSSCKK